MGQKKLNTQLAAPPHLAEARVWGRQRSHRVSRLVGYCAPALLNSSLLRSVFQPASPLTNTTSEPYSTTTPRATCMITSLPWLSASFFFFSSSGECERQTKVNAKVDVLHAQVEALLHRRLFTLLYALAIPLVPKLFVFFSGEIFCC